MARLIELTKLNDSKHLVNIDHITDVWRNEYVDKTMVYLSNCIDGEHYLEVKETLEQVRILVNGHSK